LSLIVGPCFKVIQNNVLEQKIEPKYT